MNNSEPYWIPASHHSFLLIAVRAVNRKPEAAKSEIMFTFPPSRTQIRIYTPAGGCAHAKYMRQSKGRYFQGTER